MKSTIFVAGVLLSAGNAFSQFNTAILMHDINGGNASSHPSYLAVLSNTLFYMADNGTQGIELWHTSGFSTSLLKDIYPLGNGCAPGGMFVVGGELFFFADNGPAGVELWRSNGTASGTSLVKDINPGVNAGINVGMTTAAVIGNTLYFQGHDGTNGYELWKSDGTLSGTSMVYDAPGAATGIQPFNMTAAGSNIFFYAYGTSTGDELWKSDGSSSGTQMVKDIFPGVGSSNFMAMAPMAVLNNSVIFQAGNSATVGMEPWISDGTSGGTFMIKDINPLGASISNNPWFTVMGGFVYFAADDGTNGQELWRTDGTSAGTTLVKNIYPGFGSSAIEGMMVAGGALYFRANDGVNGKELWMSDGTATGTKLVKDINPGSNGSLTNGQFSEMLYSNGLLFFNADDGTGGNNMEVWYTDGTTSGTGMIDVFPNGSSQPKRFIEYNSVPHFVGNNGTSGYELFYLSYSINRVSNESEMQLLVYPNPASQQIRICCQEAGTVRLLDLAGRQLMEVPVQKGDRTLALPAEQACFILEFMSDDGTRISRRLVTQK